LAPARRVEPPVLRARGDDRKTDCPPTGTPGIVAKPNSIFSGQTEGIEPQKARKKSRFHPKTSTHEGFSVPCVPKQHVRCLKMGTKWGMGHFFRPCLEKKRMDHQMFWFQISRQLHCDEQTLGIKPQNVPSIQKNR